MTIKRHLACYIISCSAALAIGFTFAKSSTLPVAVDPGSAIPVIDHNTVDQIAHNDRSQQPDIITTCNQGDRSLSTNTTTVDEPDALLSNLVEGLEAYDETNPNELADANAPVGSSQHQIEMLNERILDMLEKNPNWIHELISQNSLDQSFLLIEQAAHLRNEKIAQAFRTAAIELTRSNSIVNKERGLELLAYLGDGGDPIARRQLLDVGWAGDSDSIQLAVAQSLAPVVASSTERAETVALLTQMAHSSLDFNVRSAAISQLGAWDNNGPEFTSIANEMINSDSPELRVAGIEAFGARGVPESQRPVLLDIAMNPHEDIRVRISAANALRGVPLQDYEFEAIAALLQQP